MKKSVSLGSLQSLAVADQLNAHVDDEGYLSDGPVHSKRDKAAHERKKGIVPDSILYSLPCFIFMILDFSLYVGGTFVFSGCLSNILQSLVVVWHAWR